MEDFKTKINAVPYFRTVCLLKSCASLLRMPPRSLATALAYLHSWHRAANAGDFEDDAMLAACLLLASKVEEAATSNNHLLNVVKIMSQLQRDCLDPKDYRVGPMFQGQEVQLHRQEAEEEAEGAALRSRLHGQRQAQEQPAGDRCRGWGSGARIGSSAGAHPAPGRQIEGGTGGSSPDATAAAAAASLLLLQPDAAPPDALRACVLNCEVLVGSAYYAAKQAMLDAEQRLLRALQFRVRVVQPHALLLNAARCLRMPSGVQRLALAILNDLWAYTDFCMLLVPSPSSPSHDRNGGMTSGGMEATMAVLEAATRLSGWQVWVPTRARDMGLQWWQLLGLARDDAAMANLVTVVMQACADCHQATAATSKASKQGELTRK
ncbi:hypothetical protein VaNZ11_011956 [Volvox africanus]|uniref:Cyclin N-terminal domain-containing protein n=1 Tax=Volvox africanus TaxID=51714 RepID=A0ABQ5SCM1_9CHLO|nr:hypothetical protein VaNZ11_011956 [Volvox africanus]